MTALGKYLKLSSSAGNVEIEIPGGKLGLNLDLSGQYISDNVLSNFSGSWDKRHVTGTVNGGGIPVEAHASSGNVDIKVN